MSEVKLSPQIIEGLEQIINLPIARLGRAGNMMWMGLGQVKEDFDIWGSVVKTSDFSLNVQSKWRIQKDSKIIVGSGDFYYPERYDDDFDWSNYDWDTDGNLFEKISKEFIETNARKVFVDSFSISALYEIEIIFSNGMKLEIFQDGCFERESELWRFFKRNSNVHIVSTNLGIKLE
ncbi:hypothetical protein PA598K_04170 [Paenibacillus sp. 598K]|uniref:hypothetical protein n=1 Tax=Paenibacillus sp. 598K TaxID=1117987 RepID=UPI000FF9FA47|nr:hypothetical protein [Paenibacillus sp. 598K]GBF75742.1 hypothetical protein PA598K_04170 [Paenibacillus sp. 598K]